MSTITDTQAIALRAAIERADAWIDTQRGRNGWASYRSEDAPQFVRDVTNEMRSQVECYDWQHSKPERYFAYWRDEARMGSLVTNWMGQTLGVVTWAGVPFRSGMGDKRRHVHVQGNNGRTYYGVAQLDNGTYVRLHAMKQH